ncbi:MAG: hypothetical protein ACYDER_02590 [Ktedonobacteraceae bacterium]
MSARRIQVPTRAFVLTTDRVLLLEDPTDSATSTAARRHLAASCSLDRIIFFEVRSHILDCALTFVMATANGVERVTVTYNGVGKTRVLVALACIRALLAHLPFPPYTRPDDVHILERTCALKDWYVLLSGPGLRQKNAVISYLTPGKHILEWLEAPAIDESRWWQQFGISAYEQPSTMLVRTNRQILLVKETKRLVRKQETYGSDAWILPLEHLSEVTIVAGEHGPKMKFTLKKREETEVVHRPILPELVEHARALVSSSFVKHE